MSESLGSLIQAAQPVEQIGSMQMVFGGLWSEAQSTIDDIEGIFRLAAQRLRGREQPQGDGVIPIGVDGIENDGGGLVVALCPQQQFRRMQCAVAIGGCQSERAQLFRVPPRRFETV